MKHTLRLVAGAALLLALAACHAPDHGRTGQTAAPMELKIYAVPADQTQAMAGSLGMALGSKATVTMAARGKLLVYAAPDTQNSIGTAITTLGQSAVAQTAPAQVTVRFLVVAGQSGAGADDPALKDLDNSLNSLRRTIGPMHFHLEQRVSALVADHHEGSIDSSERIFHFQVGAVDKDTADISLTYGVTATSTFKTHIRAPLGQYVVLAQMSEACLSDTARDRSASNCQVGSDMHLLIIRVDRLNPQA